MASSSSSHTRDFENNASSVLENAGERRKAEESIKVYDVFISHRGPDVKKTLALQLYKSLKELGIHAFLDSEEKELGISFPSSIRTAISSARVHIAIFSKGYAESPWCLEELVLMLKTEANIIPVFYEVEPSALRHIEKGVYAQAFNEYVKKSRYIGKLDEWKEALDKISKVAGHEIKKSKCPLGFRRAAPDCKEIVLAVQSQMKKLKDKLYVAKYPVGLPMLVEDFERRCNVDGGGKGKAQIVGICGMGGAGKTTLSKELFNRYSSKYTRASFLFDVREAFNRDELYSLHLKLLKDLFAEDLSAEDQHRFGSKDERISYLQARLRRIPVVNFLIVVDDIDHLEQLEYLLVTDMVNKSGDSLIIVSTRDAGVLNGAGITTTYPLQGLDEDDARNLFCCHAFGLSTPGSEYKRLVDGFVQGCQRLPLSLQILGSHVKGKNLEFWDSALEKVKETLPKDIKATLKISIDSLDREQKEIFMDIACFFNGNSKNLAKRVGDASGWKAYHSLEILKEKFIVQEIETKRVDGHKWEWDEISLRMHDHLRDLGREMAMGRESLRRRLWQPQDPTFLESEGEFSTIITKIEGRCLHSLFDTSTNSKIKCFLDESASLLWLQLDLNSDARQSIPSWIPLQKLQCLRITNGRLERLWQDRDQAPPQLKELQISETFLEEVPDLGKFKKLENVVLDANYMAKRGWSLLESLGINIITLCFMSYTLEGKMACSSSKEWGTPRYLIIRNFDLSEEMVFNGLPMSRVENLEIGNQNLLTKVLIRGEHCPHLESLKLHQAEKLIEINLFGVETLTSLEVNNCKNLKRVSKISDLTKLVDLNISECPELESELDLPNPKYLQRIRVDRCRKLKCLELIDCKMLVELNISECPELESELCLCSLYCLKRITVDRCRKLKRLELIDCKMLVELNISECPELDSDLCLRCLSSLKRIAVDRCRKLKWLELINCEKLVELNIYECPELKSELCLRSLYSLERITVNRCKLKCLELIDCKNLEMVSGMEGLEELAILNIQDCPELRQLPAHNLSCWERITIDGCEKLNCHAFYSLLNLKIITFDIRRAVEGAELILNPQLFSQVIGANAITEMDFPCPAIPQTSVSKIIICGLVVVDSSTPLQYINCSKEFHLRKGRWIVTMVIADPKRNTSFISAAVEGMCFGIVVKGFRVTLMKDQEGETRNVLQTIDDKLYQK